MPGLLAGTAGCRGSRPGRGADLDPGVPEGLSPGPPVHQLSALAPRAHTVPCPLRLISEGDEA